MVAELSKLVINIFRGGCKRRASDFSREMHHATLFNVYPFLVPDLDGGFIEDRRDTYMRRGERV